MSHLLLIAPENELTMRPDLVPSVYDRTLQKYGKCDRGAAHQPQTQDKIERWHKAPEIWRIIILIKCAGYS
jgi:hypothetical protein